MAECHQHLATFGYEPWDVMLPAVKASLKRALELEPDLAEAHSSLSFLHYNEDDLPGAETEARKVLELNPSRPEPHWVLSELAGIRGDKEGMLRSLETAYHLDPIRPNYIRELADVLFLTGREQEALEHWSKTEHLAPADTYGNMTPYYISKGDLSLAREYHSKYMALKPTTPWVTCTGGFIDALAGDREGAKLAIKKQEDSKMGPVGNNFVAFEFYALGDMDRYFEYLDRAVDEHVLIPDIVMYSPLVAKAREDPRYGELVGKLRRMTGLTK